METESEVQNWECFTQSPRSILSIGLLKRLTAGAHGDQHEASLRSLCLNFASSVRNSLAPSIAAKNP
jgi:hypothetical protein